MAEKSSWLGLPSRSGGGSEPWKPATCKLVEEGGGCVFSVFLDVRHGYILSFDHLTPQNANIGL